MKYLVDDLLVKNVRGADKMTDLFAFDAESKMPAAFVPSMFYTFMYESKSQERLGVVNFYDKVPLILCTDFDGRTVRGLNFNLIPNNVRASILDKIVNSYKQFYKNPNPDKPINENFGAMISSPESRETFFKLLNDISGLKIDMAYRTYNLTGIKNVRMVEYDMWKYIPFLCFKDAVRGASLGNIQRNMVEGNRR